MVQVDIFWSYGLASGLALAGSKQIKESSVWWENKAFLLNLLWIACVFAPSGIFLLWSFPGWETMFVAARHEDIPGWVATVFAFTNISQGVLGFFVTAWFLRRRKKGLAISQTVIAHLMMLFILVVGWDGSGYKRFFYAGTGEEWHQGVPYEISHFFSSPVFYSLLGLGVVFIPTYFGLIRYLGKETLPTSLR